MEVGDKEPTALYPNLIFAQGDVPEDVPDKAFGGEEIEEEDEDDESSLLDYDDADFY